MGKIDTEAKAYFSNSERFSDIFHFWVFDGKDIIQPDDLHEMDTTSIAIPFKGKSRKHVQKYRDILKLYAAKHDEEAIYLILGLETEAKIHYAMPVRAMLYDAMQYSQQVQNITEQRRKDKILVSRHEYLSGLGKNDRLLPVITLVLNISGKEWDGCQSIHELLSVKKKQILRFVPDYKLNLLSPDLLAEEDFDKFRTSLGAAMQFIKHQNDEDMSWMENKGSFNVDRATIDFLQTATGTSFDIDENDEVIDMCKAWKNSMDKAKATGKAEGRAEGLNEGILSLIASFKELSIGQQQTVEQLMKRFSLTHDEALATVQSNW